MMGSCVFVFNTRLLIRFSEVFIFEKEIQRKSDETNSYCGGDYL